MDIALDFLDNSSVSAFLGALAAFLLVKFTDSRRIGRDHRLVSQHVKLNQTLARDKTESIERNLEALSQNKVMGAPIMKFSVDELKNLEMKALNKGARHLFV